MELKKCKGCEKTILRAKYGSFFEPPSNYKNRKFCSSECRNEFRMKYKPEEIPEYKICKNCRKLFPRPLIAVGKLVNPSLWVENYKYCSRECYYSDPDKNKNRKPKFSHESSPQTHSKTKWGYDNLTTREMTEEEKRKYGML